MLEENSLVNLPKYYMFCRLFVEAFARKNRKKSTWEFEHTIIIIITVGGSPVGESELSVRFRQQQQRESARIQCDGKWQSSREYTQTTHKKMLLKFFQTSMMMAKRNPSLREREGDEIAIIKFAIIFARVENTHSSLLGWGLMMMVEYVFVVDWALLLRVSEWDRSGTIEEVVLSSVPRQHWTCVSFIQLQFRSIHPGSSEGEEWKHFFKLSQIRVEE